MKKLTKTLASKVLETVDAGLVSGLGKPEPGKMCVEAAVCYAYDLEHSDNPPCVGSAVRLLKIVLNDRFQGTIQKRAKLLRRLAIAQLGSDTLDQVEFAIRVVLIIYQEPGFVRWANDWLSGKDRSKEAAARAARAAARAAEARAAEARAAAARAAARAAAEAADFEKFAEQVVQILIVMKSPGTKYLYLTED